MTTRKSKSMKNFKNKILNVILMNNLEPLLEARSPTTCLPEKSMTHAYPSFNLTVAALEKAGKRWKGPKIALLVWACTDVVAIITGHADYSSCSFSF